MKLATAQVHRFRETVWDFYGKYGRELSWRQAKPDGEFDPYKIMVSEIMLQQTQVSRVIPKYHQFLRVFPTVERLAQAKLGEVLKVWSGLGYNRRAKYLHQAAQRLTEKFDQSFPQTLNELTNLPGVGKNTAGAILVYAFNHPAIFIETNIRTVYLHHFFANQTGVSDQEIRDALTQTLDTEQPRQWYWALMDYGAYLKKQQPGNLMRSKHYKKQSVFVGSQRQIRGQVIRLLTSGAMTAQELNKHVSDKRLETVLDDLIREGLVIHRYNRYHLG